MNKEGYKRGLWLKVDMVKEVYDTDKLSEYYSDEVKCFTAPLKKEITIGSSTFSGHLNADDRIVIIDDERYDYGAMVVRNEEYRNYKTKYEELEKKYNALKKKKRTQYITVGELIRDLQDYINIIFKEVVYENAGNITRKEICTCVSNSKGVKPFLNSIVREWFFSGGDLVIVIEEDDEMWD